MKITFTCSSKLLKITDIDANLPHYKWSMRITSTSPRDENIFLAINLHLSEILKECLICELGYKNKICFMTAISGYLCKIRQEFENLFSNFKNSIYMISTKNKTEHYVMSVIQDYQGGRVKID